MPEAPAWAAPSASRAAAAAAAAISGGAAARCAAASSSVAVAAKVAANAAAAAFAGKARGQGFFSVGQAPSLWWVLADHLIHVLCFLRTTSLGRLLYSSLEAELRVRLLLPAVLHSRGWGEQGLSSNPLNTLHLSEMWDLLVDVSSPIGVRYMLLRHTLFGTMLELRHSQGTPMAHFGFLASDEATPMWCRGSFVVRGALQCRNQLEELRQRPKRMPITQDNFAKQTTFRVEHCGDRFVLRPAQVGDDVRPQLQLTKRGFIAIAAEGGGVIVEDGQPPRRIEADAPEEPEC